MMNFSPLIRPKGDPKQIAQAFASWSKSAAIMTKGRVRIGYDKKSGRRGLFANQAIRPMDVCVSVPTGAMMTAITGMKDRTFTPLFEEYAAERAKGSGRSSSSALDSKPDEKKQPISPLVADIGPNFPVQANNLCSKLGDYGEKGFIQRQHVSLGLHMTHVHLTQDENVHPYVNYLNFLPREEGDFTQLGAFLRRTIEGDPEIYKWCEILRRRHYVPFDDIVGCLAYFMCMIYSRAVPVQNFSHMAALADHSPVTEALRNFDEKTKPDFYITAMVPILDMANHDNVENAYVAGPSRDYERADFKYYVLQACRELKPGDEVLMTYGTGKQDELGLLYGIAPQGISVT